MLCEKNISEETCSLLITYKQRICRDTSLNEKKAQYKHMTDDLLSCFPNSLWLFRLLVLAAEKEGKGEWMRV